MTITILASFLQEAEREGMRELKGKRERKRSGVEGNEETACVPRRELL